jgi:hypothetical protein
LAASLNSLCRRAVRAITGSQCAASKAIDGRLPTRGRAAITAASEIGSPAVPGGRRPGTGVEITMSSVSSTRSTPSSDQPLPG